MVGTNDQKKQHDQPVVRVAGRNPQLANASLQEPHVKLVHDYIVSKLGKVSTGVVEVTATSRARSVRRLKAATKVTVPPGLFSKATLNGLSLKQIRKRVQLFEENGVKTEDAVILAMSISFASSIVIPETGKDVVKMLYSLGIDVVRVVKSQPSVIHMQPSLLQQRLDEFAAAGFEAEDITKMITGHPDLLAFPIDSTVLSRVKEKYHVSCDASTQAYQQVVSALQLGHQLKCVESKESSKLERTARLLNTFVVPGSDVGAAIFALGDTNPDAIEQKIQFLQQHPINMILPQVSRLLTFNAREFCSFEPKHAADNVAAMLRYGDIEVHTLITEFPEILTHHSLDKDLKRLVQVGIPADVVRDIMCTRPKILFGRSTGEQAPYSSVWARYDLLVSVFPETQVIAELSEHEFYLLRINAEQFLTRTAAVEHFKPYVTSPLQVFRLVPEAFADFLGVPLAKVHKFNTMYMQRIRKWRMQAPNSLNDIERMNFGDSSGRPKGFIATKSRFALPAHELERFRI